jgi:hypothetical protein
MCSSSLSSSYGACALGVCVYSSLRATWGAKAKVLAKAFELGMSQRFGQNISGVVRGTNAEDMKFIKGNEVPNGMVFDPEMSYF